MLTNEQREANLRAFAESAARIGRELRFPTEAIVAQWAVESGWGERVTGAFNFFGMTYNPKVHGDHPFSWHMTSEVFQSEDQARRSLDEEEWARTVQTANIHTPRGARFQWKGERRFLDFESLDDAVRAYVRLLKTGRYSAAYLKYLGDYNVTEFLMGIAKAGYATGPGYGELLVRIANQENVKEALRAARQEVLKGA